MASSSEELLIGPVIVAARPVWNDSVVRRLGFTSLQVPKVDPEAGLEIFKGDPSDSSLVPHTRSATAGRMKSFSCVTQSPNRTLSCQWAPLQLSQLGLAVQPA